MCRDIYTASYSNVPGLNGLSGVECSSFYDYSGRGDSCTANPDLYSTIGDRPSFDPVQRIEFFGWPLYFTACSANSLPYFRHGVMHAYRTEDYSRMTAFSYCYTGGGAVFFSTMFVGESLLARYAPQVWPQRFPLCADDTRCMSQTYFLENALAVFANDTA